MKFFIRFFFFFLVRYTFLPFCNSNKVTQALIIRRDEGTHSLTSPPTFRPPRPSFRPRPSDFQTSTSVDKGEQSEERSRPIPVRESETVRDERSAFSKQTCGQCGQCGQCGMTIGGMCDAGSGRSDGKLLSEETPLAQIARPPQSTRHILI
jgi:hypothetical protein